MLLRDQLFSNPIVVIAGCVTWIPLAIWIYALLSWMIMGEIEVGVGLLGLVLALMVGWVAMHPPAPYVPTLTLMASISTCVLFPFVRGALNRREIHSLEIDIVEKAYQALTLKPNNPGPILKIAKAAYEKGFIAQAAAIAAPVIAQLPKQHWPDEHRDFRRWQGEASQVPMRNLPCIECGHISSPDRLHCFQCGAPVVLDHIRGRFIGRNLGRKLFAGWLAMIALLVGVPVCAALPTIAGVIVGFVLLGLVTWSVIRAFVSELQPA